MTQDHVPGAERDDEQLKQRHAAMWGTGEYERIAETLRPMHDELVGLLRPQAQERWLDLATGTGEVAIRAARAGARVTGVDLAQPLIERARNNAMRSHVAIDYEVGDVERLRHPDGSFDVVASAVGAIFAPDHRAVAREMARVCRPGGRLGLTAWNPEGGVGDFFEVMKPFQPSAQSGARTSFDWGRLGYVKGLLGGDFEIEGLEFDAPFIAESGVAAWEKLSSSYGPTMVLAASLGAARREELRQAVVAFYERFRFGSSVCHPRRYLLILGRRR